MNGMNLFVNMAKQKLSLNTEPISAGALIDLALLSNQKVALEINQQSYLELIASFALILDDPRTCEKIVLDKGS